MKNDSSIGHFFVSHDESMILRCNVLQLCLRVINTDGEFSAPVGPLVKPLGGRVEVGVAVTVLESRTDERPEHAEPPARRPAVECRRPCVEL